MNFQAWNRVAKGLVKVIDEAMVISKETKTPLCPIVKMMSDIPYGEMLATIPNFMVNMSTYKQAPGMQQHEKIEENNDTEYSKGYETYMASLKPQSFGQYEKQMSDEERSSVYKDKHAKGNARSIPASTFSRATSIGAMAGKLALFGYSKKNRGDIITQTLCEMRGAALKLGQMLSIQDEEIVPPEITEAFERVRNSADYMPEYQMEKMLNEALAPHLKEGQTWETLFSKFDKHPIGAASIGQVHRGTLIPELGGHEVAIKIQYPGVSQSVDTDIQSLLTLLRVFKAMPKGAYLENTLEYARQELKLECDYEHEASNQTRYNEENILSNLRYADSVHIPKVYSDLSTKEVLITSWIPEGLPINEHMKVYDQLMSQHERNRLCQLVFELSIREIFDFRFVQTDPNFANYFITPDGMLHMIDFGNCLELTPEFVKEYFNIVYGAAMNDDDLIIDASTKLGFLTGAESKSMLEAHCNSAKIVAMPFMHEENETFNFKDNYKITSAVKQQLPVMLRERLTPPPTETYAIHRKLSGMYLMCAQIGGKISTRSLLDDMKNIVERL